VDARLLVPPEQPLSLLHQVVNVVSGLVIKPFYMLLSLVLILFLRRAHAMDLRLLQRSLVLFLAGELFCAVGYTPGIGGKAFIDVMHGAGMVAMGAYLSWGLFELLDSRVLRFADPEERCVMQRLCGRCFKREPVSCGVQQVFRLLAPGMAVVSLIPLCGPLEPLRVGLTVFGTRMVRVYYWPVILCELRLYPIAGYLLLAATGILMWGGPRSIRLARLPMFWGLGFETYALVRFFLVRAFLVDPTWADFWEESTELITVAALGLLLWVFRFQLGLQPIDPSRAAGGPQPGDPAAPPSP
jgi:hypothetical protein